MKIWYDPDCGLDEELLAKMEEGARLCALAEGVPAERAEVSLTLASPEDIRELNRDYRNVDRVTDVLSFPQYEDLEQLPDEGEIPLGDVVICRQQASAQAEEFGHSEQRELVYLFIHSICHLLGHDHMEETDKAAMRAREESVMKQLGLPREF